MVALHISSDQRSLVRDAMLPLQLVRANVARAVEEGKLSGVDWVARPRLETLAWIRDRCEQATELVSVSHAIGGGLARHRKSFALNRELVKRGVRMTSLFDLTGITDDVAEYIVGCADMPYFFSYGPMPLKIFDRSAVLLEGPRVADMVSVMVVSRPDVVAAAQGYVRAVRSCAVPAASLAQPRTSELTARQHHIARLLSENLADPDIAELVGVSVRTVRAEVAILMRVLGAETRFTAGTRYAQLTQQRG